MPNLNQGVSVLVAEGSRTFRKTLSEIVCDHADAKLIGEVASDRETLEFARELDPDLILLDVDMPELGGLQTLQDIIADREDARVAIVSAVADAKETMRALALGAIEVIQRPEHDEGVEDLRRRVGRAIASVKAARKPVLESKMSAHSREYSGPSAPGRAADLVAIAISTGGPKALSTLLPQLPADLDCPVLVVQHMAGGFTRSLAESLDRRCAMDVREASEGEHVEPNTVLLAPGGRHMGVTRGRGRGRLRIELSDDAQENGCRPAANVLFRSIAREFPGRVLAIVMTGMGCDGLDGVEALKAADTYCLAQDRDSSVVYGMPRLVAEAGFADEVVSLAQMADRIKRLVRGTPLG